VEQSSIEPRTIDSRKTRDRGNYHLYARKTLSHGGGGFVTGGSNSQMRMRFVAGDFNAIVFARGYAEIAESKREN